MNEREKKLKQYYRKVNALLPCNKKTKAAIMQQIRDNTTAYITENPKVGFDQIEAQFGAPETIAAAYVESTGTAEILKSLYSRRKLSTAVTVVIAVAITALFAWLAFLGWAAVEAEKSMGGTIEVITRVVDDGDAISTTEETDYVSYAP